MVNGLIARAGHKSADSLRKIFFVCIGLSFVTGCSTLSEEECLVADWQLIGREDGVNGRDASYIGNHRKACAEYGVVPDLQEYERGYGDGLVIFCTEQNGFLQGQKGIEYNSACPAYLEQDFLAGYRAGHEIYLLRSKISRAYSSINKDKEEMTELGEEITALEKQLISDQTSAGQRMLLLQDLKVKQKEHSALESEIRNLEIEAANLEGVLTGMGY